MTLQLLLHEDTEQSVKQFVGKPSHAIIVEGKPGSGKRSLANQLAAELLDISVLKLSSYQYLLDIEADGASISIESIRQAQNFLKLKTTGQTPIRRVLIVERAELMTTEAQNAFLKILEEPPSDTVILILTSQKIKLLPTIRSRVQILSVKQINRAKLKDHFQSLGYDENEINTAFHAANAQIGLMTSLLSNDEASQQINDLKQAKELLAMTKFERLAHVDQLLKEKDKLPGLISALTIINQAALKSTLAKGNETQAKRWHKSLKISLETEQQLLLNPNHKLLLTNLLLNL